MPVTGPEQPANLVWSEGASAPITVGDYRRNEYDEHDEYDLCDISIPKAAARPVCRIPYSVNA
jgi:hypothetical protein